MTDGDYSISPMSFLDMLHDAGIPHHVPLTEQDILGAAMLQVVPRSIRRWRSGRAPVPGPVVVALRELAKNRRTR